MIPTIRQQLNQILNTPATSPDIQRRGRILNSLLLLLTITFGLAFLALAVGWLTNNLPTVDFIYFTKLILTFFAGSLAIYTINRYWSSNVASALFLLQFTILVLHSDDLSQVLAGRSTIIFIFPILLASLLFRAYASFIVAGLLAILAFTIAQITDAEMFYVNYITYFLVACIPWFASRNLEQAIINLQEINQELDQRVALRTTELQQANLALKEQIIERQRTNDALQLAYSQALVANQFKSELLSRVSHELRTPLGAVLGFAEMLRAGVVGQLTAGQANAVAQIIENNRDLTVLVNDLLDQAQLEAGKLQLNIAPFAIEALVHHVYTNLNVLAHKKGLTLTTQIEPDVPSELLGDMDRLNQILVNLVSNSIKYTPTGFITLRVLRPNEAYWAMQVIDSGPGIAKEAHEHVFEAFRQLDGSLTRRDEGVGLGLAIVKQLTTLMKGYITLDSDVGQGSCFTITLPILEIKR